MIEHDNFVGRELNECICTKYITCFRFPADIIPRVKSTEFTAADCGTQLLKFITGRDSKKIQIKKYYLGVR